MAQFKTLVEKVRSKNAGPFWLTVDIFCKANRPVEDISDLLTDDQVAALFAVEAGVIQRYALPEIGVLKFSLPRPKVQGTREDRDMHGASFAILLEELEVPDV